MSCRHLLKLSDLSATELRDIVALATELKRAPPIAERPFAGRTLAMIFAKNSTRTRVSFESGMAKLGGHALFLNASATQIGRDEPLADTARVLSRMCDALMIRNDSQEDQHLLAQHSRVPVINGLSDRHHPCQLIADLQTWTEHRGDPAGKVAAWVGDGNNVCHSWIEAATLMGFTLRIATPDGYAPDPALIAANRASVEVVATAGAAVSEADVVITDTWTSMGQEAEAERRLRDFSGYQVDGTLMRSAKADALFLHCLPAHRGEEVTAEVIDGPHSQVWDEAENRLWGQMALLAFLWGQSSEMRA